jgi:hypothetical protein
MTTAREVSAFVKATEDGIENRLAAPFEAEEVRFKPAVISGNRALALAYVDARAIQDRLDEVLGVSGWQDDYECLPDGSVVCRLRLRLGDKWITKMDVGGPSEQPDEGDRRKAAFSDALKRAAVKFGIGRYLYRLPAQWVDYDAQKRRFLRPPTLPATAHASNPASLSKKNQSVETRVASLATGGSELLRRLTEYDGKLAQLGLSRPGELVAHVVLTAAQAGYGTDVSQWNDSALALARDETKRFEARARERPTKEVA